MSTGIRKRIGLSLHNRFRKNEAHLHKLNYLFWECTLRCNSSCLHCGSDCRKDNTIRDMPLEDFLRVIDEIVPFVVPEKVMICLTGGEALMRDDIEECGVELTRRGFSWGLVTNGYLLTGKRLDGLIRSGIRAITISLDGLEQNHNWLRGSANAYQKTLAAIKLVTQTENLTYDVVTCVNRRNILELGQIRELLVSLSVKKWRLFTIFPVGRAKNDPDLQLSDHEFVHLMEFIRDTRKEGRIMAGYGCEGFLGEYEMEVRDQFFFCSAGIHVGSILADGSIGACPSIRADFTQGNIHKDNFMEVWNNRFEVMRNRNWTRTGKCRECKSYKYCEGNGLHLWDPATCEPVVCHLERIEKGQ
ncbi:MAG: TIGR04133 family radical SAM/SPASM protein [Bacteroidetes bacterium]|nr:TIGR04133 family radical SAM/SPASM protein [Bacteroidota bacterium]